jgi:hypothetical protein
MLSRLVARWCGPFKHIHVNGFSVGKCDHVLLLLMSKGSNFMCWLLSQKVGVERFRDFRHSSVAHLVRCNDPIIVELIYVSGSLFSEVV